jgi:hypothetical protein
MTDVSNLDVKLEVTLCIFRNSRGGGFFYINYNRSKCMVIINMVAPLGPLVSNSKIIRTMFLIK